MNFEKIKRRLDRLKKQRDDLAEKHKGKESEFTYHAGYSLGYIEGRISVLEDVLDDISET